MKLVMVLIQPGKLELVKKKLFDVNVTKMTVTNALGCGQQAGYSKNYRGSIKEVNLLKKIKLEIVINDEFLDSTVNAIIEGAFTGNIGDGKIFITTVEDCIRIRTKEQGPAAVG